MNVLHLINELKKGDKASDYLFELSDEISNFKNIKQYIITGKDSQSNNYKIQIIQNANLIYEERSLRNFFKALTFIREFCRENKIDIIHSHDHYSANIAHHTTYTIKIKTIQSIYTLEHVNGSLKFFNAQKYLTISQVLFNQILSKNSVITQDLKLIYDFSEIYSFYSEILKLA